MGAGAEASAGGEAEGRDAANGAADHARRPDGLIFDAVITRREGRIFLLITERREIESGAPRITMADGRALPAWLRHLGRGVIAGSPPEGLETIRLRISAMVEGAIVSEIIEVEPQDAVIQSHRPFRESPGARPGFSAALRAKSADAETEALALALAQ